MISFRCLANCCQVKNVKSDSYTTTDGLVVSSVAYISTFQVECSSGRSDKLTLFAEIGNTGRVVPVSTANGQYQVSWTEEIAKSRSGEQTVKVYDEEGFSQLRKAQRKVEEGGAAEEVKPLLTVAVNHSGVYKGLWFNIETLATLSVIFVWYSAYSLKSKLVA